MGLYACLMQYIGMRLLRRKNPTCLFYGKSCIENSELGRFNTLFDNVFVSCSRIGDFTYVQKNTNVINADIGKFCSIAAGVRIGLGSHPTGRVSTHPAFYSVSQPLARTFSKEDSFSFYKKTIIGHDVWIGENALIKDGVKIGTGAVVGAGAVVTKDVPSYSIVAGVPATVIKYRFDVSAISEILKTEWWGQPVEWFEKNYDLFKAQSEFIEYFKKTKG